jgi:acetoin utilization deacetylase AcuC-like enzyme
MTITVVGNPATNPRYYRKLNEIDLTVHHVQDRRVSPEQLALVHTPSYLRSTADGFSEEWVGRRPDLTKRASHGAGASLRAASLVYRNDARKVFVPDGGRPHACPDSSDRGCVYNDLAMTALWLKRRGLAVSVIDMDGLYASCLHTMLAGITGISTVSIFETNVVATNDLFSGAMTGLQISLEEGDGDNELVHAVDGVVKYLHQELPEVILLNVGVTGHESDELTTLQYTMDGIYESVVRLSQAADEITGSRIIGFGGVASAGNEWASTIWAGATHALSLPYLASSAYRHAPQMSQED